MGADVAKIIIAILVVVALYNLGSSPNAQGIINGTFSGSSNVIKSLEGR